MTYEDAIKKIKQFGLYHAIGDLPNSVFTVQAFELAIEALEKQIPKKPDNIFCPTCGNISIIDGEYGDRYDYCYICGQAINWNRKENEND